MCVCKNIIIQAESRLLFLYFIRKSWILLQPLKGCLGCRCQVDGGALQQPEVKIWTHINDCFYLHYALMEDNKDVSITVLMHEHSNKENIIKVWLNNIIAGVYCTFL